MPITAKLIPSSREVRWPSLPGLSCYPSRPHDYSWQAHTKTQKQSHMKRVNCPAGLVVFSYLGIHVNVASACLWAVCLPSMSSFCLFVLCDLQVIQTSGPHALVASNSSTEPFPSPQWALFVMVGDRLKWQLISRESMHNYVWAHTRERVLTDILWFRGWIVASNVITEGDLTDPESKNPRQDSTHRKLDALTVRACFLLLVLLRDWGMWETDLEIRFYINF